MTDPYGRILGILDRNRYFFFQVAPQLFSRGWVDPVPDSLLLRKSGSSANRTQTSGSHIPPKRQLTFSGLQGVILQKETLLTTTAVGTWSPTQYPSPCQTIPDSFSGCHQRVILPVGSSYLAQFDTDAGSLTEIPTFETEWIISRPGKDNQVFPNNGLVNQILNC
jgi:hypothetical protein